jgi:NAD(P)-dependent dehydrogenase (short-subunit alcohol dehydrogenase family)
VLVNNAHSPDDVGVDALEITDEAWEATFAANTLGRYRLSRALGKPMATGRADPHQRPLRIGFLPNSGFTAYGATKAGLWMLTRYLSVECAPRIRVNGLCPGLTVSEMSRLQAGPVMDQFRTAAAIAR